MINNKLLISFPAHCFTPADIDNRFPPQRLSSSTTTAMFSVKDHKLLLEFSDLIIFLLVAPLPRHVTGLKCFTCSHHKVRPLSHCSLTSPVQGTSTLSCPSSASDVASFQTGTRYYDVGDSSENSCSIRVRLPTIANGLILSVMLRLTVTVMCTIKDSRNPPIVLMRVLFLTLRVWLMRY